MLAARTSRIYDKGGRMQALNDILIFMQAHNRNIFNDHDQTPLHVCRFILFVDNFTGT